MAECLALPDQPYIEQIRQRLWCGREFGQAAVMVGAGFSRNATPTSTNAPPFAVWENLTQRMYETLYPAGALPESVWQEHKVAASMGFGPLKLAYEYKLAFGRQELETLLLKAIPDNQYNPGKLHEYLLSLPWSDVFTTNYDTLLERTRPAIHDRKYDLVYTPADIPRCMRPRIVKLHGSLPSHRPFIITEEDYRTYPKDFAPFVNMVQQAIMENVLCLIGFSGDDPNFLMWTGWVRDNLGKAAPPIYLIGLSDLSTSFKRVLEHRNIIFIDLSPWFPAGDLPDTLRYQRAIEWFLLTLEYGEPPNINHWPAIRSVRPWAISPGLPDIPPGPEPVIDLGELAPSSNSSLTGEELQTLCARWRKFRERYPGWVVAPKQNREMLWQYTRHWVDPVLNAVSSIPPLDALRLLYELNWRLEIVMIPLFISWVKKMVRVLDAVNPFPKLVPLPAEITPDKDEYQNQEWPFIQRCWVELCFALTREARDDQDQERFQTWIERLRPVVELNSDWQSLWYYEQSQFFLFRGDLEGLRKIFKHWVVRNESPIWKLRRTAILAELGELDKAKDLAEQILVEIRFRLRSNSTDYALLSQEGWAMLLLKIIHYNPSHRDETILDQYRDRWAKLDTYKCDPQSEIELLELILEGPSPAITPEKEIKVTFDPDRFTVTYHLFSNKGIGEFRHAFAFLRMFEQGALPMCCGSVSIFSTAIISAAKWVAPFAPQWSLGAMIRSGRERETAEWFDRVRVATLTPNEVEWLYQIFTTAFSQAITELSQAPEKSPFNITLPSRQVSLLCELLSRLSFRLNADQMNTLFDLAMYLYTLPLIHHDSRLYDYVGSLFQRLLYAAPQSQVLHWIPKLLALPVPTEAGLIVDLWEKWPEPFHYINWLKDTQLAVEFDRSTWTMPIAYLLRVIEFGTAEARSRALLRLIVLDEISALTAAERQTLGQALWARIDPKTGLPSDTELFNSSFLSLPEPEPGQAKERFRVWLMAQEFLDSGDQCMREWLHSTAEPWYSSGEYIDWSAPEAVQLLEKAVAWWKVKKVRAVGSALFVDQVKEHFTLLAEVLSRVILPRLTSVSEDVSLSALRLLDELKEVDICTLSALPMKLFITPTAADSVGWQLREGLNSMDETTVKAAVWGLFRWVLHGNTQRIPAPPSELMDNMINLVLARQQPGLDQALEILTRLVYQIPRLLSAEQLHSLYLALRYLEEETRLPEPLKREMVSCQFATIQVVQRPHYRALTAALAYQLYRHAAIDGTEVPEILEQWRKIAQEDPLPEVRRAWPGEVEVAPK